MNPPLTAGFARLTHQTGVDQPPVGRTGRGRGQGALRKQRAAKLAQPRLALAQSFQQGHIREIGQLRLLGAHDGFAQRKAATQMHQQNAQVATLPIYPGGVPAERRKFPPAILQSEGKNDISNSQSSARALEYSFSMGRDYCRRTKTVNKQVSAYGIESCLGQRSDDRNDDGDSQAYEDSRQGSTGSSWILFIGNSENKEGEESSSGGLGKECLGHADGKR